MISDRRRQDRIESFCGNVEREVLVRILRCVRAVACPKLGVGGQSDDLFHQRLGVARG